MFRFNWEGFLLILGLCIIVALMLGCTSMSHQRVSYIDASGTPRDSLGRNAELAGYPLCSEVTLKGDVKACRVR